MVCYCLEEATKRLLLQLFEEKKFTSPERFSLVRYLTYMPQTHDRFAHFTPARRSFVVETLSLSYRNFTRSKGVDFEQVEQFELGTRWYTIVPKKVYLEETLINSVTRDRYGMGDAPYGVESLSLSRWYFRPSKTLIMKNMGCTWVHC